MRRTTMVVVWVLCVAVFSGCATQYGASGITGGYKDTKVDETHYIVEFNGNGYASKQRVHFFWLYRCSELTVQKGYEFFSLEPVRPVRKSSFQSDGSAVNQPAVYRPENS